MTLSIIIVSWNVRELLKRCLESIQSFAPSFPFEVIVVDNGSRDGSPEMIRESFPSVNIIVNQDNRGFAAACNQGIAVSTGSICFFLNPDCEITAGALDTLMAAFESDEKIAGAAPRVLNGDGSLQRSIARFPSIASQLLIFFKLNHLFPHLPVLRHYRWDDFSYDDHIHNAEQPMGAGLGVRRSTLSECGNFDERFFIWYEEVDLCKRIHDKGYRIVYNGASTIVHQSGRSFAQVGVFAKQVAVFTSARQYLEKHFGLKATILTLPMRLFTALVGAFLPPFPGRSTDVWTRYRYLVVRTFVLLALAEALSFAGYFSDQVRVLGFCALTLATFGISLVRLEYGLWIALSELIVGSKGYLFSFPVSDGFAVSIRMGIFIAIGLAWIVHVLRSRRTGEQVGTVIYSRVFRGLVLLGFFYFAGVIHGLLRHDPLLVFKDANGWLAFLLIIPLYDAIRSREQVIKLFAVASGALLAQTVKIFGVFYIMTHKGFGFDLVYSVYRWVRTTGVGEVAQMSDHFTRIFFQSQVYAVVALFVAFAYLVHSVRSQKTAHPLKLGRVFWIFFTLLLASILLSLSRSFWIAIVIVGIGFVACTIRESKQRWRVLLSSVWRVAIAKGAAIMLIAGIAFFPLPSGDLGLDFGAFAKRFRDFDSEAAARSRWALAPVLVQTIRENSLLGYGFGKTVTYTSYDPRVRERDAAGTFTTYTFEWGYLDQWIKLGFFGLLSLLFFLWCVLSTGWKAVRDARVRPGRDQPFLIGLWFGVLAVAVIHIFTPYLVHPLGIGILIIAMLCFERFTNPPDTHSRIPAQ